MTKPELRTTPEGVRVRAENHSAHNLWLEKEGDEPRGGRQIGCVFEKADSWWVAAALTAWLQGLPGDGDIEERLELGKQNVDALFALKHEEIARLKRELASADEGLREMSDLQTRAFGWVRRLVTAVLGSFEGWRPGEQVDEAIAQVAEMVNQLKHHKSQFGYQFTQRQELSARVAELARERDEWSRAALGPSPRRCDRRPPMASSVSPWWLGLTTDHIYEDCPARVRSLPELKHAGWDKPGMGSLDPEDPGVCGWCLRVWRARNKSAAPTTPGGG